MTRRYDERFEPRYGPLRRVVRRVVDEYLECGGPEGGFARIRCPNWIARVFRGEVAEDPKVVISSAGVIEMVSVLDGSIAFAN